MTQFEVRRTVTTVVEAQSASDALKAALAQEDWSLADVTIRPAPQPFSELAGSLREEPDRDRGDWDD